MEEESTGTLKGLADSLSATIRDRMISPLLPSFLISWLVVNFKIVVMFFSDGSYVGKFEYMDTVMYPSGWCGLSIWLHWVGLPLLSTLFYIYLYPLVAVPVYEFALRNRGKYRKVQQKDRNETLLTKKESEEVFAMSYDREQRMNKEVARFREENIVLNSKIATLEKTNSELSGTGPNEDAPSLEILRSKVTPDHIKVLEAMSSFENRGNPRIAIADLARNIANSVTDVELLMGDLLEFKYVIRNSSGYSLTNLGRKSLKEFPSIITDIQSANK